MSEPRTSDTLMTADDQCEDEVSIRDPLGKTSDSRISHQEIGPQVYLPKYKVE